MKSHESLMSVHTHTHTHTHTTLIKSSVSFSCLNYCINNSKVNVYIEYI